MQIVNNIDNLFLFKPVVFKDPRGLFYEKYKKSSFDKLINKKIIFKQDNMSFSKKNALRGLHFQSKPNTQEKLISVISGKIYDVVVNINPNSTNFKKHYAFILSSSNKYQLWIPSDYAHGFFTLTDNVIINYKVTTEYKPKKEKTIIWNDKELNINWPLFKKSDLIISKKDSQGKNINNLFKY